MLRKNLAKTLILGGILLALCPAGLAQGTAFTYQGRLNNNNGPANGSYDLTFTLYNTNSGGVALASPVTNSAALVTNGLFTTTIDFGPNAFSGNGNLLEIAVRTNSGGAFATLAPRQQVTPTPYAITAENLASVLMNNIINGGGETVGGGNNNSASNFNSTISGGANNIAAGNASTVSGGSENNATGDHAAITGGQNNLIQNGADHSIISGGNGNAIQTGAFESFIGGGQGNIIQTNSIWCTIGGGLNNVIQPGQAYATIGGGKINLIDNNGSYATVCGGYQNTASGEYATVGGGAFNSAEGEYSFAAWAGATAVSEGAFVWSDNSSGDIFSDNGIANSFNVRAQGGVWFANGAAASANQRVSWTPGSASWSFSSDRNLKDHFSDVSAESVLNKAAQLPVMEWSYKGYGQRHIGPMAQDFHRLFPLNDDDKMLEDADLHGVELAAIQGLNQKLNDKDAEIQDLKKSVDELKALVKQLAAQK